MSLSLTITVYVPVNGADGTVIVVVSVPTLCRTRAPVGPIKRIHGKNPGSVPLMISLIVTVSVCPAVAENVHSSRSPL